MDIMDIEKIKGTGLFKGMTPSEIELAIKDLSTTEMKYKKGATIMYAGQTTETMGLVTEGSVTIENNDIWGNKTILSHVGKGHIFAETYALLSGEPMLVDVVANENSRIVFMRIGCVHSLLGYKGGWSSKFITNLLQICAQKNLILSGRSFHTSPKTIRGRVMSYLNSEYLHFGSTEFDIPFDRQQLADYLNLDRTALSKELGKMSEDGLIEFSRNHFKLINTVYFD